MAAMSGLSASDPRELVAFAEAAVDQVDDLFRAGLGAAPAVLRGRVTLPPKSTCRLSSSCG